MKKTIITVVGKDTVGIIAKVCTYLAENKVNILDISQTIVDDYFNMMMIADMSRAVKSVSEVSDDLDRLGEEIGVIIKCQREEIFNSMHALASVRAISFARFSGEKQISSGSILFSLRRRRVSTISQLDTFLGWLPRATVASKISAICLLPVIISIS